MKDTFINCAKELKVAVIGDIMLDVYVDGTVERLSPEAPNCLVLDETKRRYALGGAANVAHNLAKWGVKTRLCGALGGVHNDIYRMRLDAALRQLSHDEDFSLFDLCWDNRPVTVKKRFLSDGQQLLRVDREMRLPMKAKPEVCEVLTEAISGVDAVILSDYGKGVLSDVIIAEILGVVQSLNDKGPPIFVDPKRTQLLDYSLPDMYLHPAVICPNRAEWEHSRERNNKNARMLGDIPHVIVTDGYDGCFEVGWDDMLHDWTQTHHRLKHKVDVSDPAGAGDTFIAALAVALLNLEDEKIKDKQIGEACDKANEIAALTVTEHGIVVPNLRGAKLPAGEEVRV